ncbi:hypothetical protein [Novacetimonas pomaceti]|uniref:hypothetical protein n=1 Tax=Novacetimonas pomaceti TaxID=2021998 RepID=UPI001403C37C|nr:hypothetical protein [Novacetimonas pomaceti]
MKLFVKSFERTTPFWKKAAPKNFCQFIIRRFIKTSEETTIFYEIPAGDGNSSRAGREHPMRASLMLRYRNIAFLPPVLSDDVTYHDKDRQYLRTMQKVITLCLGASVVIAAIPTFWRRATPRATSPRRGRGHTWKSRCTRAEGKTCAS